MVSATKRGRGRPRKNGEGNEGGGLENDGGGGFENGGGNVSLSGYEVSRAQRIRENAERMKTLGLFNLSKNLKPSAFKPPRKTKPAPPASNDSPRRSSRLKDLPPVRYIEEKTPKPVVVKNVKIHIEEGENPEIYTDEHEKLLGDSQEAWELYVDGYDEDGQRIYDPMDGKSCHQCRQKTLGLHTTCSKCEAFSGQFCGDCLYMRYGENVKEVNQNPLWVCPSCRGLCNCSRCRRDKGWMPTGAIYNRVVKLGFKSVAHYLVHTRNEHAIQVAGADDNPIFATELVPSNNGENESTVALTIPSAGGEKHERGRADAKHESDEDYRGDSYEEEDNDDDEYSSGENDSQFEN